MNTTCGLFSLSSLIPQTWLALVRAGYLTRSDIFYIWLGITLLELVVTTFLFPWHSVTDPDFFPNALDVYHSPVTSLFKPPMQKGSPLQSFIRAVKHMQSPVFWSHVLSKAIAHFSLTLSMSLANDIMKMSDNVKNSVVEYETLQSF